MLMILEPRRREINGVINEKIEETNNEIVNKQITGKAFYKKNEEISTNGKTMLISVEFQSNKNQKLKY